MASISSEALNIPRRAFGMSSYARKPTKVKQKAMNMLTLIVWIIRFFVPGAVIIGDDWCNTVIKTKHRHKEDAL